MGGGPARWPALWASSDAVHRGPSPASSSSRRDPGLDRQPWCSGLICTDPALRPPVRQACYAMGYNLAIEYMADYEKTWMLDSFRALDRRVLAPAGRPLSDWVFLEVR